MSHRIAVVVPNLCGGGGVPAVARFLSRVIDRSSDFSCDLVSLATSARDSASLRVLSPGSWFGGPRIEVHTWEGRPVHHVGARFAELEFQRYRPRRALSELLRDFDLVQVVAGSPAIAVAVRDFAGPVVLQVATLAAVERVESRQRQRGLLPLWREAMTLVTGRLERAGVAVADRVLVENAWMEKTIGKWTDPERVLLAPPGVDTSFFRPGKDIRSLPGIGRYILSVGRFADPRKDVGVLFDAYAQLRTRMAACPHLVLAGQSVPEVQEIERLRDYGLEDSVSVLGEVSRNDLAELYRGATLFVLSSAEEGLGLVLLEAMSSGVPVVATRTEGARQAVNHGRTGLLTPVGDPRSLAEAIERLVADPALCQVLGCRARQRVEREFSESAAGERFIEAYRALLREDAIRDGTRAVAEWAQ